MVKKTRKRRGKKKKGGVECDRCGLDYDEMMISFRREVGLLNSAMLNLQREVHRLSQENMHLRQVNKSLNRNVLGGVKKKTRKRRMRQRGRG